MQIEDRASFLKASKYCNLSYKEYRTGIRAWCSLCTTPLCIYGSQSIVSIIEMSFSTCYHDFMTSN